MGWLWWLAIPGLYALHRLGLWMEARGWIYYRKAGSGGVMSGIMKDLEIHLCPQIRHVEMAKQEKAPTPDPEGDPPTSATDILPKTSRSSHAVVGTGLVDDAPSLRPGGENP